MDQHPYFNIIAACIALITALIGIDLIILGKLTWTRNKLATAKLTALLEDRSRDAKFHADAAVFLADAGPLEDGGRSLT